MPGVTDLPPELAPISTPRPGPEPIRSFGAPFFDDLVSHLYDPMVVRRALYTLVNEQHDEAQRIDTIRGWGSSRSYGVDRYEYGKEQDLRLKQLLPGAEMRRPNQSLMYAVGNALIYPKHYGHHAGDCPTRAYADARSFVQSQLASGQYFYTPSLFEEDEGTPTVVWLLTTGNRVEGGPLTSYLGLPAGRSETGLISWRSLEPLLPSTHGGSEDPDSVAVPPPSPVQPPEPTLTLRLRP